MADKTALQANLLVLGFDAEHIDVCLAALQLSDSSSSSSSGPTSSGSTSSAVSHDDQVTASMQWMETHPWKGGGCSGSSGSSSGGSGSGMESKDELPSTKRGSAAAAKPLESPASAAPRPRNLHIDIPGKFAMVSAVQDPEILSSSISSPAATTY